MREMVSFLSTCPLCGQPRRQHGYEWIELVHSLNGEQAIDAYCLTCDVVWPLTAEDRSLVATLITREPTRDPAATRLTVP